MALLYLPTRSQDCRWLPAAALLVTDKRAFGVVVISDAASRSGGGPLNCWLATWRGL
jgi:hypothetical protein